MIENCVLNVKRAQIVEHLCSTQNSKTALEVYNADHRLSAIEYPEIFLNQITDIPSSVKQC